MLSLHGSRRPPLLRPGWKRHFHANCMKDALASRSVGVRSFVSRLGTTAEGNEEALRIDSPWGTPSSPACPRPREYVQKSSAPGGGGACRLALQGSRASPVPLSSPGRAFRV